MSINSFLIDWRRKAARVDARRNAARIGLVLGGLGCAALPPSVVHEALAATAGTLFEAAPFVLAAALVRGRAARLAGALAGCGCGDRAVPAALSLPATALCWAVFGPWPALGRLAAAAALARLRLRAEPPASPVEPDPLAQLGALALPAFALALFGDVLGAQSAALPPWLALGAGLGIGMLAPCATTAVALAGMLRTTAPLAAAATLATAGLVPRLGHAPACTPAHDARPGLAVLAVACAAVAARHGAGFVNPRLVPLLWCAAAVPLVLRSHRTSGRFGAAGPALMLAALVAGSPAPLRTMGDPSLAGAYPGEPLTFTGTVHGRPGHIVLERAFITCCRADAAVVSLATDLPPQAARRSWVNARGTLERRGEALILAVDRWRPVAPPDDPFAYR